MATQPRKKQAGKPYKKPAARTSKPLPTPRPQRGAILRKKGEVKRGSGITRSKPHPTRGGGGGGNN